MDNSGGGYGSMGMDPGLLALMQQGNAGGGGGFQWAYWLPWLLIFGRRGFGFDGEGGGGVRTPATYADLSATQNALQGCFNAFANETARQFADSQMQASNIAQSQERDIFATQASIANASNNNLMGQKDIMAQLAACCCDLRVGQQSTINAIDKCCCETQNAIAIQTNQLQRTMCDNTQKILDQQTAMRISELETNLGICRDQLSNAQQTATLQASIREACCQPCQPHPWWPWMNQGNGGNGGPPGPP